MKIYDFEFFHNYKLKVKDLEKIIFWLKQNITSEIKFQLINKFDGSWKKTSNIKKFKELIESKEYEGGIIEGKKECVFELGFDIEKRQKSYISYGLGITIWDKEIKSLNLEKNIEFFLELIKPEYMFGLWSKNSLTVREQSGFYIETPFISWSNFIDDFYEKKKERKFGYLCKISNMKDKFGKIIPQLYSMNWIENKILNNLEFDILSIIENNKNWEIKRGKKYTYIQYKNNPDIKKMFKEQNRIRRKLPYWKENT